MINFYRLYSHKGLDKEEYSILIEQVMDDEYTKELGLIESIIKKSPRYAYEYAMEILKGRWIEAEPYIIKDSFYAYLYAKNIMKSRWIEAEHYFKGDSYGYWWNDYCEYFKI